MTFKPSKRYTEKDIIRILRSSPKMVYEISHQMYCSDRTIKKLIIPMLKKGEVKRRNRGNPNKPVWEYYLSNDVKIEQESKKGLKGLMIQKI